MIVRPIVCKRFVGREAELQYLHERRREAGRSRGGLIFVTGEGGGGKSRLIAEFTQSLSRSRWRTAVGRCLEFAQRPYAPILEIMGRFDPADAELAPAASKREQFDAVIAALARAASRTAIVAVVEDLHWADAGTIELLAYLATKLDTMRVLVVVSLRSEDVHAEHPLFATLAKLERTPNAGRIALAPLTGGDLRLFIDDALSGLDLPDTVRADVARASEGNPFFTEELLKSAVERASELASGTLTLPTTVRAAVLERLRPLTVDERRVVTQAAVIGRRFDLRTLSATLGDGPATIASALQRARLLQLIEEESPETFRFRHELTREAIYGQMLTLQLRPIHRTILDVLERAAPEERAIEHLAYHAWAAGDAERAARYNELAGDAAGRVYAHADALRSYERAASVLPAASIVRAGLLEKIAERQSVLGLAQASLQSFTAAADTFQAAGDHEREAASRVRQAIAAYSIGRPNATAPLHAMLERLEPADYRTRSLVHLGIAWIAASFYFPDVANAHVAHVDPRAIGETPEIRLRVHNVRAWTAMTVGDADAFGTELAAWVEAAKAVQRPGVVASTHYNGGYCYALLGLHEDARAHTESGLALARAERNRHGEVAALSMQAGAAVLRGDLASSRSALDVLAALATDDHVTLAHGAAWGSLTGAHTGDDVLVERWFDRLEPEITPFAISLCGAGYAEILVRRGRASDARALLARRIRGLGELPRGIMLTLLAVARYGSDDDAAEARSQLAPFAALRHDTPERYALPLFDALRALRKHDAVGTRRSALDAADGFRRLGYRLLEATAREVAGERTAALTLYRACGASYDAARLEPYVATRVGVAGAPTGLLSTREREVAVLVARGLSNLEIARTLEISRKTVEKHLGSTYQKLGFSTRAQLGAYISRT